MGDRHGSIATASPAPTRARRRSALCVRGFLGGLAIALLGAVSVDAQSIAQRVASAPDGVIRVEFAARPGTCGDGRDMVGYGRAMFAHNFQSIGRWHADRCVAGPLRVSLYKDAGDVDRLDTQVGGAWPSTDGRVTDLGVVDSREASAFFFSIAPKVQGARGKDRSLLPAVLAADADVLPPLLTMARNDELRLDTRRQAVLWLGLLGDASVVPALKEFARGDVDDDGEDKPGKSGKHGLATAAMSALGNLEDGAGVPALIDLSREANVGTRRNAVFWLGQTNDARAIRRLHEVIEDGRESDKVREHAVFSLSQTSDESSSVSAYIMERVRDRRERTQFRKNALFWAGQREATPTAELVRAFREADTEALREHAIFVLSQRDDEAATNALMGIARDDKDREMRGKALFWLAQKHDPRVQKLIADLILK